MVAGQEVSEATAGSQRVTEPELLAPDAPC